MSKPARKRFRRSVIEDDDDDTSPQRIKKDAAGKGQPGRTPSSPGQLQTSAADENKLLEAAAAATKVQRVAEVDMGAGSDDPISDSDEDAGGEVHNVSGNTLGKKKVAKRTKVNGADKVRTCGFTEGT